MQLCLTGQTQGLFPLWNDAVDCLFSVANPIPVKVLMQQQQTIQTSMLRPPLTHLELKDNTALMAFDKQINQWLAQADQSSFINTNVNNRNIA